MRRIHSFCAILASMMLLSTSVKAQDSHSTNSKSVLRDAVKDKQENLPALIQFLEKVGKDDKLDDEAITSRLGLPMNIPVRVAETNTPPSIKGWQHRECAIVYSNLSQPTDAPKQAPQCVYIYQLKGTGRDAKGYWFRVSLDGKLEKALLELGKNDENGNPIRGSGVQTEQDIESSEVKKAFSVEMKYWTKEWLKQQKAAVKSTTK